MTAMTGQAIAPTGEAAKGDGRGGVTSPINIVGHDALPSSLSLNYPSFVWPDLRLGNNFDETIRVWSGARRSAARGTMAVQLLLSCL